VATKIDHQRPAPNPWELGFGAVTFLAAVLMLTVWIPNDMLGGFIDTGPTGQPEPGDAFFPTLVACTLLVLSLIQLLNALINRPRPDSDRRIGKLTPQDFRFLSVFYVIVLSGLTAMYWFGPLTVEALRAAGVIDSTYRQLIDTPPYKYLGYLVGGFGMTCGLIYMAEKRLRWRAIAAVVVVLAASILIFDVLLSNVQLPPNADF
jgi:hypothetical protein